MNNLKPGQNNGCYTQKIGQLAALLQYTRACTIAVVENCTKQQLDFLVDEKSNSIATLLKHIAALEFQFQRITFNERKLNKKELQIWEGCFAGQLSKNCCKNKPASYYISLLKKQRCKTLAYFKNKTNKWLSSNSKLYPDADNLFFWFHLAEDELCHTGQIKYMLKRIP